VPPFMRESARLIRPPRISWWNCPTTALPAAGEAVSGTKERRPAFDRLVADARRRRFDVLLVWRLDRLGRSLKHLAVTLDEFAAVGIAFVSLNENIDCTRPAGKLQLQLAAIAEFERSRIIERVRAGLARAKAQSKRLGRPRIKPAPADLSGMSVRQAASLWGVSKSTAARWINSDRS
jgi:DNA invertase Pin-like site-specific DNA recombinase